MFGFGRGRGCRGGMGMHGTEGWGMGPGYTGHFAPGWAYPPDKETELAMLKRYRDRIELRKKELEAELEMLDKRIKELEK